MHSGCIGGLIVGAGALGAVGRAARWMSRTDRARAELDASWCARAQTSSTSARWPQSGSQTVGEAQERLSDSFKALSAEALQSSMAQLAELSRAQLQTAQAEAKGDLEKRQQAVEQLVAPLKEQLGRVDAS